MSSSSAIQTQEMAGDGGTTKAKSMEKKIEKYNLFPRYLLWGCQWKWRVQLRKGVLALNILYLLGGCVQELIFFSKGGRIKVLW